MLGLLRLADLREFRLRKQPDGDHGFQRVEGVPWPGNGAVSMIGSAPGRSATSRSAQSQSLGSFTSTPSRSLVKNGTMMLPAIVPPSIATRDQAISRLAF